MPDGVPWLITRKNGTQLDRHAVTRQINGAAMAAGLSHTHPTSCGTRSLRTP
jgi:hypothetical protein